MIKLILYTIFVSMLSSFLTIKLRSYYIKKQLEKHVEDEKKRADSIINWFKNDLMNNISAHRFIGFIKIYFIRRSRTHCQKINEFT